MTLHNVRRPKVQESGQSRPQTERTLSSARLCEGCGTSLGGRRRQARYCSAKCRTLAHRSARQRGITALLTTLERTVASLRQELSGDSLKEASES
jgi:hypothetical protein